MDMIKTLGDAGIIPVIVIDDLTKAVPLAQALVKGGLPVLEVTFRTACAAEAIAKIKAEVPGARLIAGTVLTLQQLTAAKAAGAEACVAPGFDPAIVKAANELGLPFCPGVATASELSQALALGCKMVKFFPAESAGGVKYIKDLLGAFRWTGVKFMPTGGVKLSNVGDYLAVPEIICCGGTWIAPKDAIKAGDWAAIEKLAADAAALAREIKSK
ncbi:MAG: bifunctional 4-hydroxy-2-oxoglutarate aldolase/2-dehydro-3-deoxy-phosphogluconate aldolase [Kiritimatiellae bacterium]|nr:bifunctional 4-hydroxy-2-oxoglutarate aldolase/2-dehydro-3-deoxy-phosphogluconate aldolase [Kiritimatiellia bacterium]